VGGGFLGLLLGLIFFPVLGVVIGAVAGGLIGRSLHHDKGRIYQTTLSDELESQLRDQLSRG
jgi:uncharacterized membrane protein